jgi:sulfur carrier protein
MQHPCLKTNNMQIILNGESTFVDENTTITQLIEQLQFTGKRIAVEINEAIVPRSAHVNTLLREGDKVEIVHAIGGG